MTFSWIKKVGLILACSTLMQDLLCGWCDAVVRCSYCLLPYRDGKECYSGHAYSSDGHSWNFSSIEPYNGTVQLTTGAQVFITIPPRVLAPTLNQSRSAQGFLHEHSLKLAVNMRRCAKQVIHISPKSIENMHVQNGYAHSVRTCDD